MQAVNRRGRHPDDILSRQPSTGQRNRHLPIIKERNQAMVSIMNTSKNSNKNMPFESEPTHLRKARLPLTGIKHLKCKLQEINQSRQQNQGRNEEQEKTGQVCIPSFLQFF